MQKAHELRRMAELSSELTKELDSMSDRAYQISCQLSTWQEQASKAKYSEVGVQADLGTQNHTELPRARRLAAFSFEPFTAARKMNWAKVRSLNLDRMMMETDTRSLMDLFDDLAHVELERESGYNLTEANLLKLLKVSQLMLQYMQWNVEQGHHAMQVLQEERTKLTSGLHMIPDMTLKDVDQGLAKLGKDFTKIAEADMDAMFTQVRTEERTAAKDVVAGVMDQARKELARLTATIQTSTHQDPAPLPAPGPTCTSASPARASASLRASSFRPPAAAPYAPNLSQPQVYTQPGPAQDLMSLRLSPGAQGPGTVLFSKDDQAASLSELVRKKAAGASGGALPPAPQSGCCSAQDPFTAAAVKQQQQQGGLQPARPWARSSAAAAGQALFRPGMGVSYS